MQAPIDELLTLLYIERVSNNAIIPQVLGGYELNIAYLAGTLRWLSIILNPTRACGITVNYCWFSVTPFKIDQIEINYKNRSID